MSGWVLVNTPPQTWSVADGMLMCTGKPIGEIRTEQMYQNFELELEWRHLVPGGNAGVFVWADDITAPGQPFHRGIEVQVLENAYGNTRSHTTHGDIFPIHGATMTPENGRGGSRAFPTEERSKPSPEWNHYRIVCHDGTISLAVNGKVVTRGKDASPRKGYICLESEGGVVHYRNINIRVLPDTPLDAKHVATANRGFRSLYSGLDLEGWQVSAEGKQAWTPSDWVLKFAGGLPAEQAALTMQLPSAPRGVIVDFRQLPKSISLSVEAPGHAPVVVPFDQPNASAQLKGVGAWNRLELLLDQTPTMKLNGQPLPLPSASSSAGPLTISAQGPLELANIYVR